MLLSFLVAGLIGQAVTKRRYTIQDSAVSNPDAYIGIYQKLSV